MGGRVDRIGPPFGRTTLATPGSTMAWAFQRQADGQLVQVNAAGRNYNFTYDSNGLLKNRSNPWRSQAITRDGQGRIVTLADTVGTATAHSESMTWRADSKLTGYTATRSGTGAWNDSRSFNYNSRDQLTTEGVGLSTGVTATDTHTYDTAGLGVHVGSVLSSGSTNNWSTTLDGFSRALVETINQGSASLTASGLAVGSASLGVTLNGTTQSGVLFDPKSSDGKWRVSLIAPVGTNKVIATGTLPINGNSATATNTFIVLAQDSITDSYDNAGNLTTRTMTGSRTQTLKWDALGRLVKVQLVDSGGNGYSFASVYDGLGRRIRTIQTTLTNSVAVSGSTVTVDSYFDPLVEFLELGVSVNGLRTWTVYGPDLAGGYGAQQGIGGLEATVRESDGFTTGLVSDLFGNTLATTTGWNQVNWTSMRVSGFGPVEGYQVPVLSSSVNLAEATLWRGKRIDPTGYYHFGVRYQDPIAGRWLSPDPVGHGVSMSLYDYCGNDPINSLDPDGRQFISPTQQFNVPQFPGQPGSGYSLDNFYRYAGQWSGAWDNYDQWYYQQVSQGTSLYPFGGLSPMAISEAHERGYVGLWDLPLDPSYDGRGTTYKYTAAQGVGALLATIGSAGVEAAFEAQLLGASERGFAGSMETVGGARPSTPSAASRPNLTGDWPSHGGEFLDDAFRFGEQEFAPKSIATRNPDVYEALFESPISGASRAAHRASANEFLANQLRNDSQLSEMLNQELGGNVLQHMESGRSLLNPLSTVWHHPFDNPSVMQLLRTGEHTTPSLQPVLHPGGVGGFGNFYGP
jgi:RHS repeat-associated protein